MAWGEDDPNAKQQPKSIQVQPPCKALPTDKDIKNECKNKYYYLIQ